MRSGGARKRGHAQCPSLSVLSCLYLSGFSVLPFVVVQAAGADFPVQSDSTAEKNARTFGVETSSALRFQWHLKCCAPVLRHT